MTYEFPTRIPINPTLVRRHDWEAVKAVFAEHKLTIADTHVEMYMWAYVLTTDAQLWLHDASHGGGGYFELQKNRPNGQ